MAVLVISLVVLVAAYAVTAVAMLADRRPYPGQPAADGDTPRERGIAGHPAPDAVDSADVWRAASAHDAETAAREAAPDADGATTTRDAAALMDEAILATWRLSGYLPTVDYRQAMERLAAEDDLRHPLAVPPG
jgi:hypothetical protein